jgi:hypothetical protein
VALVDGSWIDGEDLAWDGTIVTLIRPDGRGEIPVGKVQSVAWRQADDAAQTPGAAWLSALPDTIESDLLVVGSAAAHEFVECAITSIGPESITVVLDEETIPVKRSKVIGIHWLRGDPAAQGGGAGSRLPPWQSISSEGLSAPGRSPGPRKSCSSMATSASPGMPS